MLVESLVHVSNYDVPSYGASASLMNGIGLVTMYMRITMYDISIMSSCIISVTISAVLTRS